MNEDLDKALDEVYVNCSAETYNVIVEVLGEMEEEIEGLHMELDSINLPKKKRRPRDEDWE
jgi:hypothetical protein